MDASETAGAVVQQANWNPMQGPQGFDVPLVDDQGNATTAVLELYACPNTWAQNINDTPGDFRMMRGYLDTADTDITIVVISGVPYATYDVYLYSRGDGFGDRQGLFYVNDLEADNPNTILNTGGDFFDGTYEPGNNYTVFPGQSGELVIFATPDPTFNGGKRAPLNGIQIVNASGN